VGLGVVILEDDSDLRASLKEAVSEITKSPCVDVASYNAMAAREDEVLHTSLAILDINLGPGAPSGLDAHEWLVKHAYRGRVVFLTGHARSNALVASAANTGNAILLEKPIDFDRLAEIVMHGDLP
jgi:FixJ family two-component response regulator